MKQQKVILQKKRFHEGNSLYVDQLHNIFFEYGFRRIIGSVYAIISKRANLWFFGTTGYHDLHAIFVHIGYDLREGKSSAWNIFQSKYLKSSSFHSISTKLSSKHQQKNIYQQNAAVQYSSVAVSIHSGPLSIPNIDCI